MYIFKNKRTIRRSFKFTFTLEIIVCCMYIHMNKIMAVNQEVSWLLITFDTQNIVNCNFRKPSNSLQTEKVLFQS